MDLPVIPIRRSFRPTIYWYVSFRCNLACKHCWVNSSPDVDTSGDLSTNEMLNAVSNMKRLNPAGVILTGGEPLIRNDINLILAELVRQGVNTFIETNAMKVTDSVIDIAREALARGTKFHFAVSLDGGTEESHDWIRGRGSFSATVRGLHRLREAGIPADIQCVVHKRNWNTLTDLVNLAKELDITYLKFVVANPVGRANEHMDDLIVPFPQCSVALRHIADALRHYNGEVILKVPPAMIPPSLQPELRGKISLGECSIQNVTSCHFPLLGVLPDGSVTVCSLTKKNQEAYFGNIRDITLNDVWRAKELDLKREKYLSGNELQGICGDCVFKHECRGACRAHAFAESGSFEAAYPICAAMEREGYFPNVYRHSFLRRTKQRLSNISDRSGAKTGDD